MDRLLSDHGFDHRSYDQLNDGLTVILASCGQALAVKMARKGLHSLFCARFIIGTPSTHDNQNPFFGKQFMICTSLHLGPLHFALA